MRTSLRIALPTSCFLPHLGGAQVGLHNIATKLLEKGYQPIVIAPYPDVQALKQKGWQLPYLVKSFPPKVWGILEKYPSIGLFLLDKVFSYYDHQFHFDFWHVTMGYPTGVAMVHYAQNKPKVRYLIRCAGEDIQRSSDIEYGLRHNATIDKMVCDWLPKADHLIAISNSVASEYRALGVDDSHIEYIPNGVDVSRFNSPSLDREQVRRKLNISNDTFVFLSVGRNHKKKYFSLLIAAAERLTTRINEKFVVVIIGDGVSDLQKEVDRRNSTSLFLLLEPNDEHEVTHVQLPSDELVSLYCAADAFVFPSIMETFGIVLVEAMAAKLPIITTDAPGCRDVIRGGRDGLMVPVKDVTKFVDAMENVITNESARSELIGKAMTRVNDFSWDTVVDKYITLYLSSIGKNREY